MSYQTAAYHWTTGEWGKGAVGKDMNGTPDGPDMKFVGGLEAGVYSAEVYVFAEFATPQPLTSLIYCQFYRKDLQDNLYDIRNIILNYTSTSEMVLSTPMTAEVFGLSARFNVKCNQGDTIVIKPPDKIVDGTQENFFEGASEVNMTLKVTKLC